jgi:hypothetical protein
MKTKLTTLNPRWTLGTHWATPDGVEHYSDRGNAQGRYGMGISFDCPLHVAFNIPVHSRHRINIFFANPMDGLPPEHGVPLWQRGGASFKALTVSPTGNARPECWHGLITNGEIT